MENKKIKAGLIYGAALLVVLVGGLSCYIYATVINSNRFAPGVEIAGISVQGKNMDEASADIKQGVSELYATPVIFYKDDYKHESKLGDLCLPIDNQQVLQSIWEQEKARDWRSKVTNLSGRRKIVYSINLAYNPAIETQLMQEWNKIWGSPASDASLDMDNRSGLLVVSPGQPGVAVDEDATFQIISAQIDKIREMRIPIIIKRQEPQITDDVLNKMGQLSSFTTNYDTALVNRSHNLGVAVSAIDKSMIAPHAAFSFNETLGQCSAEKGYLDAMVIVGGKFEPGLAGGICQVSSTLYNAALLAGMDILERRNHSLAVAYVPLGRDATVSNGSQDFKFMNNTDDPLYIRAAAGGGRLTISIYGNIQYKKKITLSNSIDQTFDYTTIIELDPTLNPGEEKVDHNGQLGYVVRSFRTFYDDNGTLVKSELLARDTYYPLNKLVYRGPDIEPVTVPDTVTPPPDVTDDDDQEPNGHGQPEEPVQPGNRDHIRP